jgi:hypothetical protein
VAGGDELATANAADDDGVDPRVERSTANADTRGGEGPVVQDVGVHDDTRADADALCRPNGANGSAPRSDDERMPVRLFRDNDAAKAGGACRRRIKGRRGGAEAKKEGDSLHDSSLGSVVRTICESGLPGKACGNLDGTCGLRRQSAAMAKRL